MPRRYVAALSVAALLLTLLFAPRPDLDGPVGQDGTSPRAQTGVAVTDDADGGAPDDIENAGEVDTALLRDLLGKQLGPRRQAAPAGRPPFLSRRPGENAHSPPEPSPGGLYVSSRIQGLPVVMSDAALPWQVWLDRALLEVHDEAVIREALASWDGTLGSRWAVEVRGFASGNGFADGRSTVFMEQECAGLTTANAYVHAFNAIPSVRYGDGVTNVIEADIGICPSVSTSTALARAIRHEVGHVMGQAHLCDPGNACWVESMGTGPSAACRTLFWQVRDCQTGIDASDRAASILLYPTARPLHGPGPARTAARASFALWADGEAPVVVVIPPDAGALTGPAATTLAARVGGPILISPAVDGTCLSEVVLQEAARVLARRGTIVLVGGAYGNGCAGLAAEWDVRVRQVSSAQEIEVDLMLGHLGGTASDVVLTRARGADGPGAALLAARMDVPLVTLPVGPLPPAVRDWLVRTGVRQAWAVGELASDADLAAALAATGVTTRIVAGQDRWSTAVSAASVIEMVRAELPAAVITPDSGIFPGLIGASVGARVGASLLARITPQDPRLVPWLQARPGIRSWVVATDAATSMALVSLASPYSAS